MLAMLSLNIGEAVLVIPINIGITLAFGGMMMFYHYQEGKPQA
jgi:hypothetical protein